MRPTQQSIHSGRLPRVCRSSLASPTLHPGKRPCLHLPLPSASILRRNTLTEYCPCTQSYNATELVVCVCSRVQAPQVQVCRSMALPRT